MPAQSPMKEASDQRGGANPDQSGGINVTDNIRNADLISLDVGMIDNNGQELARAKENDARFRSTLGLGLNLVQSTDNTVTAPSEMPDYSDPAAETAKVAKNRDAVLKHMLKNDMTLEEFKTEHPKEYSMVVDTDSANPDDNFIHRLAEVNRKVYSKDPSKAEATTKRQLKAMGYDMSKLDKRASMYNRISNGTALTVAQGMSGINKFLEMIGAPDAMRDEMAVDIEKILSETTEADGKLYESLKPSGNDAIYAGRGVLGNEQNAQQDTKAGTDMATTVGKVAPLVATGIAGGARTGGMILGDLVPGMAVVHGSPDATSVDRALALLSPIAGMALANSLSKWTKRTYDSVEDFEKAVRAEPHLIDDLKVMLKERDIKLEDLKKFDRPDVLPNRSANEEWFKIEKPTPAEAKKSVKGFKEDIKSSVEANIEEYATPKELGSVDIEKLVEKYSDLELNKFFNDLPKTIASDSANADEFIANILKYEGVFDEINMKPLVAWAKNTDKLSGGAKGDAITSAGLNGLLLASGNPAMAHIFPSVFKNWVNKLGSQAVQGVKKTLTKPRKSLIEEL